MSRAYKFLFESTKAGAPYTCYVVGHGNTRRSAERAARGKLRREHQVDPATAHTRSCRYVPAGER